MNENLSLTERRILVALGFKGQVTDEQEKMLLEGLNEVKALSMFSAQYSFFALDKRDGVFVTRDGIDVSSESLQRIFEKRRSTSVCVLVTTLGPKVDKKIAFYKEADPSRMVLLDACASAYIEEMTDEFQQKLNLRNATMRFAPGYGDVPLCLQREIFEKVEGIEKTGIILDDNDIMHPFKSMTGIIGFNFEAED